MFSDKSRFIKSLSVALAFGLAAISFSGCSDKEYSNAVNTGLDNQAADLGKNSSVLEENFSSSPTLNPYDTSKSIDTTTPPASISSSNSEPEEKPTESSANSEPENSGTNSSTNSGTNSGTNSSSNSEPTSTPQSSSSSSSSTSKPTETKPADKPTQSSSSSSTTTTKPTEKPSSSSNSSSKSPVGNPKPTYTPPAGTEYKREGDWAWMDGDWWYDPNHCYKSPEEVAARQAQYDKIFNGQYNLGEEGFTPEGEALLNQIIGRR